MGRYLGKRLISTIPLLLLLIAALGILVGMHEMEFTRENWPQLRQILPDMLFLLAGILTLLGAKVYLDGAFCFSGDTRGEAEAEIALLTA